MRRPLSRREWWFLGTVGLQLAILVGMVVFYQAVVSGGTEIVLRTVPVDPRDLLRGQYVALRYEISTVRPELVRGGAAALRPGEAVYVLLEERGDAWQVREVGRERPPAGTFVRGTVTGGPSLSLRYGIESYFVAPEQARELEASARQGMLRMRVAVDREGHAVLRGVAE